MSIVPPLIASDVSAWIPPSPDEMVIVPASIVSVSLE